MALNGSSPGAGGAKTFGQFADPLDIMGFGKKNNAIDSINTGYGNAIANLFPGYQQAQQQLQEGTQQATNTAKQGFQTASDKLSSGMGNAQNQFRSDMGTAKSDLTSGYNEAKGMYNTPEMVSTRQELMNRILGKGGLSPDVVAQQEAKAREEYGTGMRGAMQAMSPYMGDSQAQGMAGENMGRVASQLGAQRANAVRDINIGNEQLKRQEQTGAMQTMEQETAARAGLSAQEANAVSDLSSKLASGSASLTSQEAQALSQLAAQEGTTIADLQQRLASGMSSLTAEETKALAELMTGQASAIATASTAKTGLFGLW